MNRRSFLQRTGGALFGALAAFYYPAILKELPSFRSPQKIGWLVYEEVGTVIVNDYAISKMNI